MLHFPRCRPVARGWQELVHLPDPTQTHVRLHRQFPLPASLWWYLWWGQCPHCGPVSGNLILWPSNSHFYLSLSMVSRTCFGAGVERMMTWPIGWELRSSSSPDTQLTLPGMWLLVPSMSNLHNFFRYKMLKHAKDKANPERFKYLYSGAKRMGKDGYNSLKYKKVKLELKPLYTWVMVDLPRLKA